MQHAVVKYGRHRHALPYSKSFWGVGDSGGLLVAADQHGWTKCQKVQKKSNLEFGVTDLKFELLLGGN